MPDQPDQTALPEGDELQELRALARDLSVDRATTWEQPPADLWDRIAAETAEAGVPGAAPSQASEPHEHDDPPVPIDRAASRARRRSPWPWIVGAAAAAILVVLGLVVFADRQTEPTVVAQGSLDRLGPTGSGQAELVDDDGHLTLRVDTADLDPGDGFLEVWVIDPDVTKLVSLGPLRPDGTYDLPPGLDPTQFPIVDVSVEPLDGNPTHSGDSLLRGQLTF